MVQKLRKNNKGFTIIEVLIVLAIAGLILLIVFLAVPALQRNSRNTQRRNDVSRLLGASQEVLNNNNGTLTSLTTGDTGTVAVASGKPAYYTWNALSPYLAVLPAGGQANDTGVDNVKIYWGAKCGNVGGNTTNSDAVAGNTRQLAILYSVEPAVPQCTNS